jgi:hypothetical protein
VRLAWPVVKRHHRRAWGVAVAALALALSEALSPFVILLIAGMLGTFVLNRTTTA